MQHTPYVQIQHRNSCFCHNAYIQHRAGRAGIGGGKGLPRPCLGKNVAVTPDILLDHQDASGKDKTDGFCSIAGMEQKGFLGEVLFFRLKAGEHGRCFFCRNSEKKRRGTEHRQKIFHKNLLSLKIQQTNQFYYSIIRSKNQGGHGS